MSGLLPCPFCGGEARPLHDEDGRLLEIDCTSCTASVLSEEAWNTRAERTCHIEMAEIGFTSSGESFYHSVCSECGAYIHEGDGYCYKCGARVEP